MDFLSNIFGSKGTSLIGLVGVATTLINYFGGLFELEKGVVAAIVTLATALLSGALFIAKDPNSA